MLLPKPIAALALLSTALLNVNVARCQEYPAKPIRIITSAPGGGADLISRLIAQGLSNNLAWQVVVDNRGGVLPGEIVSKAVPDGYTLLVSSNIWITPLLEHSSFDPIKDFSPVTLAVRTPNVVVVHPSLSVKSIRELIALAKAKPGELNYGSAAPGASSTWSGYIFNAMAGVNIVAVPYKGSGPAIIDLLTGQLQLMFATPGSIASHVKSHRLTALAITSAQPSELLPGLPTVAASGLPGYEAVNTTGLFAPAKTPLPIINRINQEVVRVLSNANTKERLRDVGIDSVGSSPQEFSAVVKSEMTTLGKVFKDMGIRVP